MVDDSTVHTQSAERPAEKLRRAAAQALPLPVLIPIVATVAALAIGVGLIALTGNSVVEAITAFWDGMTGSAFDVGSSLNRSMSLLLVGLGFIFANRANLTNVGGEGQIAIGGMMATAMALHGGAAALPFGLAFVVPLLAGTLGGAVWGGAAGVLKSKRGVNEVISTLLLTFIALPLVYWSVESFHLLRKPLTPTSALPESPEIPDLTKLPMLLPSDPTSPLHVGLLIALVAVIVVGVVLAKSPLGLKLRAVGLNRLAARRAGIRADRLVVTAMAVSGGFGGLAGAIMIQGQQFYLTSDFSSGYGFDGLVVGLLARGSAAGVVLGALLFGFLRSGSIAMEITAHVPSAVVLICQGLIVIAVAGSSLLVDKRVNHG
ncbi:ABC transporter permease [Pandoraea terrae]|uniref:ABC transporter permease n=1 Tax=Pandoraea terrae TaxID=1537710 RepID=A0A5E4T3G3_9BURK|nr:ABC transporter permease [Pandoraea terrae]VVD81513.1 ABC transporter permease [Pandoraea terrae]